MKKLSSSSYIQNPETVTQNPDRYGYDPKEIELIIQLVDLMCLGIEDSKLPVS
jgi:hypothetical protein